MWERYDPQNFESAWRQRWQEADLFRTREDADRPKFYGLDFFPYPSGAGLSVGHCRNYIPTDVLCRMKHMQGFNVLHPMGFDAFGLPAENEAIKRGSHPGPMIEKYAANYRRQMDLIGISYDWSREVNSSDPRYYRWTQWIFKRLYDRGLACRGHAAVNWDPVEKTVLADEEVIAGRGERSGALVEKKFIPQWFFKITDYAQRLIDDLDGLDWPEGIKAQQRNWIGRSQGVEFTLRVELDESAAAHRDVEAGFALLGEMSARADLIETLLNAIASAADRISEAQDRQAADQYLESARAKFHAIRSSFEKLASIDAFRARTGILHKECDRLEDLAEDLAREFKRIPSKAWSDDDAKDAAIELADKLEEEVDVWEDWLELCDRAIRLELEAEFATQEQPLEFRAFTTRIDTIFGMTFCVLAPEHPLVDRIAKSSHKKARKAIRKYQKDAKEMADIDRQAANREKTGVRLPAFAINPANGKPVPLFIADYVLTGYGTGAIMAVPAHDERDFDFAQQHGLDVIPVISPTAEPTELALPYPAKEGWLFNSGTYNGQTVAEAQAGLTQWMEGLEIGEGKVNYKLRDWLISRQRYWGCPIPVVYDDQGIGETVPDDLLPVLLPEVENYQPSGDGTSPLAQIDEFVNCTTSEGRLGKRETDTMGGFACSSWYFLRFCDPHNEEEPFSQEKVKSWMPVDCYVGGAEHAVMHLLYARFWTKVLFDAGLCPVNEPFQRLCNQGQVLGLTPYRQPREGETLSVGDDGILVSFEEAKTLPEDQLDWKWVRMSKSKGNVVTPDEAVEGFGADALRVYELFVAPFEQSVNWTNDGMQGSARFLSRIFRLASDLHGHWNPDWNSQIEAAEPTEVSKSLRRIVHQTIAKSTEDIERFAFNTYISSLMILVNEVMELAKRIEAPADKLAASEALEAMILLLSPAAPHSADEMWHGIGQPGFTYRQDWPVANPELAKQNEVTIVVQINGKLRDSFSVSAGSTEAEVLALAQASDKTAPHLAGKSIRKVIFVSDKLLNLVVS